MNIKELKEQLRKIEREHGEDVEICVMNSTHTEYTNCVCMNLIKGDYYVDENDKKQHKTILLL